MADDTGVMMLHGQSVKEDAFGYVSLTDIWIAAGRPASLTPARWQQNPDPKRLMATFEEKVGKSYLKEKSATGSCLYTKAGRGGATFAHASIALAFAKALSPELELAKRLRAVTPSGLAPPKPKQASKKGA